MQSVYDPEEDQLNRDDAAIPHSLNDITGSSPSTAKPNGTAQNLAQQEGLFNPSGDNNTQASASNSGKALSGAGIAAAEAGIASGLFNPSDGIKGGVKQLIRGKAGKRSAVTGGILGTFLGLSLFGATILSGPAQLVHLSHILQRPAGNEQTATADRTTKLIRWAKTGDIGETRLGTLGSRINARVIADFNKSGITIDRGAFGYAKSITIDTEKYTQYQGTPDEIKQAMASDNKLSAGDIKQVSSTKYTMPINNTGETRGVIGRYGSTVLGDGKIITSLKLRPVFAYLGAPSWLHPINRISTAIDKAVTNSDAYAAASQKLNDWWTQRSNALQERTAAAKVRLAEVSAEFDGVKTGAGGVLIASSAICVIRDIAQKVPVLNRDNVALQAMHNAADGIGLGAQGQFGSQDGQTDVNVTQQGTIVNNFTNSSGHSIWESAPLNALQGMSGGQDIDPTLKPAFAPTNTAASLVSTLNNYGANDLCSGISQAFQGVLGVVLIVSGPGGWVFKTVLGAATTFAGAEAVSALSSYIPKLLADKPLTGVPHQGPEGGSVDAYGARELANSVYRNSGAIAMNGTQTLSLDRQQQIQNQATINKQSIADRIFNPYNENSIAGHLANDLTPSFTHNLAIIGEAIPHMGSGILSGIGSILQPKVHAADAPYQWPFPEYAFSTTELSLSDYSNPYDNANAVATQLDSMGPSDFASLNKRTEACFGVTITKDANSLWTARADNDTNPATSDYTSSQCDRQDPAWTKVRFFIFDTRTANAMDCYDGSGDSCQDLGIDTSGASSTTSSIGQTQWPFKPDVTANIIQCFTIHTGGTHAGVDIDAPRGTPVYAITAGKVTISPDPSGYGPNYVLVNPDTSTGYGSGYGHMDTATVKTGDTVKVGDQVGTEGSLGHSSGPHLHLNLFQGQSRGDSFNIDPMQALKIPQGSTNSAGCS